jgi:hypothetical protein
MGKVVSEGLSRRESPTIASIDLCSGASCGGVCTPEGSLLLSAMALLVQVRLEGLASTDA